MNPTPTPDDMQTMMTHMALWADVYSILALLTMLSLIVCLPVIALYMRHIAFHLRNLSAERR